MKGVFACPECETPIESSTQAAGRRVRCPHCRTLVEIPFFPRTLGRRKRRKPPYWLVLKLGLLLVVILAGILAWRAGEAARRSDQRAEIEQAIARAANAQERGDWASAFREIEAARRLAERSEIEPPGGWSRFHQRRDEIARNEVEARLEALSARPPDARFGEALTLQSRLDADPALEPLESRIEAALEATLERWLRHHEERLAALLESDQNLEAWQVAEDLAKVAENLPAQLRPRTRRRILEAAKPVFDRISARLEPVEVEAALQSEPEPAYDADLRPLLTAALADHGYLLKPENTRFPELWDRTTFVMAIRIEEQYGSGYLQSPHRTARITASLALRRRGETIWNALVPARTRVPLQGQAAGRQSRFLTGTTPNPAIEAELYQDARLDLRERLQAKLTWIPKSVPTADED